MMKEIDLGPIEEYPSLPAEITIASSPYWLVRCAEGEYRLLSGLCPHAGGEIRPMNDVLFCPLHFWTFDAQSGSCLNNPDERLMRRKVVIRGDRFIAEGEDE
ncbi:Rieske (2Fe-2S) protein [Cohnella yongneupensis]|uniref:Rieske (2Fe-2S) protein n=1 Tax=Cohnella yongneupensis TaxID=425006 RepID=A0ABW0R1G6_9BACL